MKSTENNDKSPLKLADIVFKWYTGAILGFALGGLVGDLTSACIGLVIGAIAGMLLQKCFKR